MTNTDATATTGHVLSSDRRDVDDRPEFRPRCSCGWIAGWTDRTSAYDQMDEHELAAPARAPRLLRAAVIQIEEPTPEPSAAEDLAAGLRALADWVVANQGLLANQYMSVDLFLPLGKRERIAAIARAGLRAGLKVTKNQTDQHAGVKLDFGGRVQVDAYAARDEVCDRVVVGTKEITEEVPDPEALAAVPKVTVTKVVDEVEWKCLPLLAEVGAR